MPEHGPSPLNSACSCCSDKPDAYVFLDFVSVAQSCNTTFCGELPCTSTEAAYDEDGNCISAATTCSPNWADLTRAEKCAAKRYLTVTTDDLSGGGTHGRTQVRQYTTDEDGNCDLETTCSGGYTETTVEEGESSNSSECYYSSDPLEDPVSGWSGSGSGTMNSTTVYNITYSEDCIRTRTLQSCTGTSNYSSSYNNCWEGWNEQYECNSDITGGPPDCAWVGESLVTYSEDYSPCCEDPEPVSGPCVSADTTTTTLAPASTCNVNVTYTGENSQGFCTPKTLPSFPAFYPTGGVAQCEQPPEVPELLEGQNQYGVIASPPDAYNFTNPYNPAITSKLHLKYQVFQLYPSPTCYTKVWFRNKVQKYKYEDCDSGFEGDPPRTAALTTIDCNPDQCFNRWSTDGEPTFVEDGTYIWQGSGYPCYPEKTKSFLDCENIIYGAEKTVIPEANTSVTVEYKYSFVEGYEPDWGNENGCQGCKPNGYPIPNPDDCPVCAP